MVVKLGVHELFEAALLLCEGWRESTELAPCPTHFFNRTNSGNLRLGMGDDIIDHQPDLIAHQLALQPVTRRIGVTPFNRAPLVLQQIKFE